MRKDSYRSEEISLLKGIFENNTKKYILDRFNEAGFKRSSQSIFVTARKMGLKRNPDIVKNEMIEAGSKSYPPNVTLWTESEDKKLFECYKNGSKEEILAIFPGRTWRALRGQALKLGLARSKEIINKDTKRHLKENFGVDSTWQLPEVREKSRQTNLLKRGVEYPTQSAEVREKGRQTVQEKYGTDNVFQSEEIKSKIAQTNLEKYGCENPTQNAEVRAQTIATNLEKYGVENPFQMVDRVQQGMLNKYGEKSPLKVPEIKEKQQKTNLERYGTKTPAGNSDVRKKTEETNLEKFGYKTPFLDPIIKNKIKETNIKKYGVTNPSQVKEIKERIQKTTFERYGVRSFLELKKIREKGYTVKKGRKTLHKSKEEINFITYLKIMDPQTEAHVENPTTKNVMDFYMPKYDLWVQYDGIYWHGKIKRYNVTRQSIKIQRTIERDIFQNEHIPNLIRFWSDDVLQAINNGNILDLIENKIIEKTHFSHQYLKKLETIQEDLKNIDFDPEKITASNFTLVPEKISSEIIEFISRYEWLGTIGVIPKWCFTARYKDKLGGVVLINEPTAYSKLLGEHTLKYEALIQRGASASWAPKNLGSRLIMFSCNWMVNNTNKKLFIGYADPAANELGTIYQACNFDYLGSGFGNSYLFKHPLIKKGKWFSAQLLKRTSSFKKWCKENKIVMTKTWFKDNGFKDLKIIPNPIKIKWYDWNRKILKESEKLKIDKKHKYAKIIGTTKQEEQFLTSLKTYQPLPYPKKN